MPAERPPKLPPVRVARAVDAVRRLLRMLASREFSLSMATAGSG